MTTCIALLRGINVGKAKRIAMADLRALVTDLGGADVRTLLNSGNVVFEYARPSPAKLARALESAIQSSCGFSADVVVLTASELDAIIDANPLLELATDPSRHLVAFASRPTMLTKAGSLLDEQWTPDRIAVGANAAYLWCASGILESRLIVEFSRRTWSEATTRNWATVLKLQAAAKAKS